MEITIKQYAESRGVSIQTATRTVNKYAEDLKGHVIKRYRTRYLDDEAVRILDEHRAPRSVVVSDSQRLDEARAEIEDLKSRLLKAYETIQAQTEAIQKLPAPERIEELETEVDRLQRLNEELSRPLTLKERLLGRRISQ